MQPWGQPVTHPNHQICVLNRLGLRKCELEIMGRCSAADQDVRRANAVHHLGHKAVDRGNVSDNAQLFAVGGQGQGSKSGEDKAHDRSLVMGDKIGHKKYVIA